MNILVFGKDGQLGKAVKTIFVAQQLEKQNRIDFVGRAECDLAQANAIKVLLDQIKPDLIVNAAAYTAVDQAEIEIDLAFAINAKAPEIMAQYAVEKGATLLHYSTDYVFDGSKAGFYTEEDARNPLGVYGQSKAAGELAIEGAFSHLPADSKAQYAILRTSWVYGDGGNFIRTILRLAKEREELKIITDQHGVPTSAEWLADMSLDLVLNQGGQIKRVPSGIYHAVPSGETTWYGLACLAVQYAIEAGAPIKAKVDAIKPILAVEYPLPAPRPMNSCMSTNKLRRVLGIQRRAPDTTSVDTYSTYNEVLLTPDFFPWDEIVGDYVRKLVLEKQI